MFYITENLEHWYKKIGMYPKMSSCYHCKKEKELYIPFISKDYVGLIANEEKCCEKSVRIFKYKPRSAVRQNILNEAVARTRSELIQG